MTSESDQQVHTENVEYEWIDNCFRAYETEFGLWHSVTKEGRELITAMTKDICVRATRFYLKGEQEGWSSENTRVVHDGFVGGKL